MSRLRSPDSTPDDIPLTDRQYEGAWDAGYEAAHEYYLDNKHRRGQAFLDDAVEALLHVYHLRDPRVPRVVEGDPSFYEWVHAVGAGAKAFSKATRGGSMSRTLTATDRSALIRLASNLPEGSVERRAILAGLVAGTAPTNVLQALVRSSTEDLGDARRRYDLLEEEYERVGLGGVRFLLDQWHIHGQDRMAVMYHYMDPLTRRAGLSKSALTAGTVRAFIEVASSKLTQYDRRLEAKQPNMYRLGHYLKALNNVREDVHDVMDDASPEALGRLRASFARRFNNLPPITATIKQIDQYLATGKLPRLVGG